MTLKEMFDKPKIISEKRWTRRDGKLFKNNKPAIPNIFPVNDLKSEMDKKNGR